jgi:hypothetical protein
MHRPRVAAAFTSRDHPIDSARHVAVIGEAAALLAEACRLAARQP